MTLKLIGKICLLQTLSLLTLSHSASAAKPLYYGFFYSAEIANGIDGITTKYLAESYDTIDSFSEFLNELANEANILDPLKYYVKPWDPNTGNYDPLYHTTAKYCGGEINCTDYADKFEKFLGQQYSTEMIGLFWTNRTYGIRIKLSEEQQVMFDEAPSRSQNDLIEEEIDEGPSPVQGIEFVRQQLNFHPTKSKAHITIGTGPGIAAVTTGTDLVDIVGIEQRGPICQNHTVSAGIVQQMGDNCDIFVLYLDYKMVTTTTFQAYYSSHGHTISSQLFKWIWLFAPIKLVLSRLGFV